MHRIGTGLGPLQPVLWQQWEGLLETRTQQEEKAEAKFIVLGPLLKYLDLETIAKDLMRVLLGPFTQPPFPLCPQR